MILPDVNNMGDFDKKMLKQVESSGYNPESIQTKKFYDKVQQQKREHLELVKEEKSNHIHNLNKSKKGKGKLSRDYRE
jgi:hypothetical protein